MNKKISIYDICEMAILIALALILDKLKIQIGTNGGSINLSAIPLIIISIRKGFLKGLISSSIVFGILSCIFDGYGLQFLPFDYILAFSGYSLVGLFNGLLEKKISGKEKRLFISITFGCILSFLIRIISHSLSSIIFYKFTILESLIYNFTYVSISSALCFAVLIALIKPIIVINDKFSKK